jgi:hypothetical protein
MENVINENKATNNISDNALNCTNVLLYNVWVEEIHGEFCLRSLQTGGYESNKEVISDRF